VKTLVVRLDHLGDVLLTTPLVRALAVADHLVDVLVQDALKPVFQESKFVRHCFGIKEVAQTFPQRWWPLGSWMRKSNYDVIILAYARERRLCLASLFSGAPRRIAMWSGLWGRLTAHECYASHILDRPRPVSEILLECSRALGLAGQGLQPDFFLTEAERDQVWSLLPESLHGRSLIGIHPGSAGNACNLPSAVYGELAGLLLKRTERAIVVTGTIAERDLLNVWPRKVLQSERLWISMGKLDLRELASVIAQMPVFICSSTGPLHIASAVGTGTVSPFCPAAPLNAAIWGNVGAPSRVLEPESCPRLQGSTRCCDFRGQITAEEMLGRVLELLAAANSSDKIPDRDGDR
jgi:ADP-heptose:LPS heptosyltransferase